MLLDIACLSLPAHSKTGVSLGWIHLHSGIMTANKDIIHKYNNYF